MIVKDAISLFMCGNTLQLMSGEQKGGGEGRERERKKE